MFSSTTTVPLGISSISKVFKLHFFTDGYPVVNNYQKELDSIFSAIKKIKGKIQAAMFVSYGYYFNKELISQMAEKLGAILIQSSMISEYSNTITKLVTLSENQDPKEKVEPIVSKPLAVFNLSEQGVVVYGVDEDGNIYVNPSKGKSTVLYYLSNFICFMFLFF